MTAAEVAAYLDATRDVEGWFFPIDALLFALVDEVQKREGISGNLFEIGVHHGKTAVFLARMTADAEILGVCDVFDRQDLNVDHSGEGSRELFLRNLRTFAALDPARLHVYACRSEALTVEQTSDRCRFFHIDGGHRPEDVFNDLEVASRAILEDGVVAVDDVFNPSWPGVSEGVYRYLAERQGQLVPIVIGGNKVLFTRPSAARRYERHWSEASSWGQLTGSHPFELDWKEWVGRRVLTANRKVWVDLDPGGAAAAHRAAIEG